MVGVGIIKKNAQIENQFAHLDSFGTNWTTMDSITQQFFGIGLICTLLDARHEDTTIIA